MYVFAFTIEADRVTAARVGLGGVVLDRREVARPRGELPPAEVVAPLADVVRSMQTCIPAEARYIGSGAAVSAMVRREDGLIRLAPHVGWVDEPLGETLAKVLGPDRPVTIRNGADLRALAEHSGARPSAVTTLYTCTATPASVAASSPAVGR